MNEFKVHLETKTSKSNKEYQVLIVTFPNGYQKMVFLDHAELYMLPTQK